MADSTPDFLLFVIPEKLTDGSEVFNVVFGNRKFAAVTAEDAISLADKIRDAIHDHTNHTADVSYA